MPCRTFESFCNRILALAFALTCAPGASAFETVFVNGFEIPCATNAQCNAGMVCAAAQCVTPGTISPGGRCSANRDCAANQFCSPIGECTSAGAGVGGDYCSTGAQCGDQLACELYGLGGVCTAGGGGDLGGICTTTRDCLAGLTCLAGGTCERTVDAFPPFSGVACAADEATFRAYFEVPRTGFTPADFFRLPFPNDARINADGTLNLDDFPRPGPSFLGFDLVDRYTDSLAGGFDGFSSVANIAFRFSRALNPATLGVGAANVHFVDITDPGQAGLGAERVHASTYIPARSLYACQNLLTVAPARNNPLRPGGIYAVYVTADVRSASGQLPVQDPDLTTMLGASMPADATLARAWGHYAQFRDYLAANTLSPSQIAAATVFTVQDTTGKMIALRDAVEALPAPDLTDLTLCDGATPSPCALPGDSERVCGNSSGNFWEIHGRMSIPNFQQGTLPYELPADGGNINFDAFGTPQQSGTLNVCFALTVPKTPVPFTGWPLVVHAHGTGGSFKSAIYAGIASRLAGATTPIATLTVDGVGHGARRGASTRDVNGLVFNVFNPSAARDNHLQGAVDVIQVLRAANLQFAVAGVAGNIAFDASKVYFFGHSQGSNVGIPAVAVSNEARAAIFSGAGSYLTESILARTSPANAEAVLESVLGEPVSEAHPLMTLWQTWFDAIDPVNFAPLLLEPPSGVASKNVYLPWGQNDSYTPNSAMNISAQAMHLAQAPPVLEPISGLPVVSRPVSNNQIGSDGISRTAVCAQYAPASGEDGLFVSMDNTAATDWTAFLVSHAQTGTATLP